MERRNFEISSAFQPFNNYHRRFRSHQRVKISSHISSIDKTSLSNEMLWYSNTAFNWPSPTKTTRLDLQIFLSTFTTMYFGLGLFSTNRVYHLEIPLGSLIINSPMTQFNGIHYSTKFLNGQLKTLHFQAIPPTTNRCSDECSSKWTLEFLPIQPACMSVKRRSDVKEMDYPYTVVGSVSCILDFIYRIPATHTHLQPFQSWDASVGVVKIAYQLSGTRCSCAEIAPSVVIDGSVTYGTHLKTSNTFLAQLKLRQDDFVDGKDGDLSSEVLNRGDFDNGPKLKCDQHVRGEEISESLFNENSLD